MPSTRSSPMDLEVYLRPDARLSCQMTDGLGRRRWTFAWLAALAVAWRCQIVLADVTHAAPVSVEFFLETGCEECERVKAEVLPDLELRYGGYYRLQFRDIVEETNYLLLVSYQQSLAAASTGSVNMVVDGREILSGFEEIRRELAAALDRALVRSEGREPESPGAGGEPAPDQGVRQRQVRDLTLVGIISAAIVDSINPCAMATLVFLMSLLSVSRVSRRWTLLAGGAFILACFVTYLAIGIGLWRVLGLLSGVNTIRRAIDVLLIAALLCLAVLSFIDAIRCRRTGDSAVSVHPPDRLQRRVRDLMKGGLNRRDLLLVGLSVGVAATLIESVSTGQVYVPALALMVKSGQSMARSACYLLLYNVVFVLPLVALLLLTHFGLATPSLVAWNCRNVVWSKTLLGLFFLGMAAMMLGLTM